LGCNLSVGSTAEVGKHHSLALRVREAGQCGVDPVAVCVPGDKIADRVLDDRRRGFMIRVFTAAPSCFGSDPIDGSTMGDRGDPGPGRASTGVESSCVLPDFDENLLRNFFRHRRIDQDSANNAVDLPAEFFVELSESSAVSTGDALQ